MNQLPRIKSGTLSFAKGRFIFRIFTCFFVVFFLASDNFAKGQDSFEKAPINYSKSIANDQIARLSRDIRKGKRSLKWDPKFGWLPSLLVQLNVSPHSQTLVFTKTSLQLQSINPRNPRAIYFNDDVYVGWVPGGDLIELSAVDPDLGAVFYFLENKRTRLKPRIIKKPSNGKSDDKTKMKATGYKKPRIVRDRDRCLTCHATHKTQGVPGYLVRSVYPKASGQPDYTLGTITTSHSTSFEHRFGGWYVTGIHGKLRHRGNSVLTRGGKLDREAGANLNILDPFFDTKKYLVPTSDLVALMVLEHQSQLHNAMTKANFEARLALEHQKMMNRVLERPSDFVSETTKRRLDSAADNLVKHLLFYEEPKLSSKINGSLEFRNKFQSLGPMGSSGKSLRKFDLSQQLFQFPCSYLIYSPSFMNLPEEIKFRSKKMIKKILQNGSTDLGYSHLSKKRRMAILEILSETHSLFKKN